MTIYKKRESVGAFAKKGEDYKDQDLVTIMNAGQKVDGEFGEKEVFLLKMTNGEVKNLTFNQTSLNNMIDAYNNDSERWTGQQAKIHLITQNVQGKIVKVAYLAHPDAILDEVSGKFIIPSALAEELKKEFPAPDLNTPPF